MASSAPLGFGIVGLGLIADFHARAIADAAGARLVAVCSRSLDKSRAFAAQHGGVFATADLSAFLARPDLDVVCIATPSGAHLEPALAAARAGKHIVIEKPLEITLDRVDALLAGVAAAGVRLMPIFQSRFGEGARAVKAAVAAGRLGRIALASAYVKWQRSAAYYAGSWHGTFALDGGGALMNQAIHQVDLLLSMMGPAVMVVGFTAMLAHERIEVEDTAVACLRFASGALGVIQATTSVHPGYPKTIAIHGDHGSAEIEQEDVVRWDFNPETEDDKALKEKFSQKVGASGGASNPGSISHEYHARQLADFVRAINTNTAPMVDGQEGRKAVAIICGIYESMRTGRVVTM